MVRSRLRDSSPDSSSSETIPLPPRMFAVGEEPKGIRVTAYHTSGAISTVLKALAEEEIQFLRNSSFGKFISLAQEPTLSGRFGRFLMSSQLKTKKKHEVWFLFAGKPVRYSLREFALVTGLPCGKYPRKSKKRLRKNITEKPYWPSLFGMCDSITALEVIKILKKKTGLDKEIRLKYACLALLSYAVLPTTHHPKIQKEHVELIKDLDEFFAYPWGRLSFELLMKNIRERNEVSLSQDTIAVPGFALSLQLVMAAAVPALKEVVEEQPASSGSDEEDDEEVNEQEPVRPSVRITLSPGHARDLNKDSQTVVHHILPDDPDHPVAVEEFGWLDEEEDPRVDNMVRLINEGETLCNSMFTGGATKAAVSQMREEAKAKKDAEVEAKRKKRGKTPVGRNIDVDNEHLYAMVVEQMKAEFRRVEEKVESSSTKFSELKSAFKDFKVDVRNEIRLGLELVQEALTETVKQLIGDTRNSTPLNVTSVSQDQGEHHPVHETQKDNGTGTPSSHRAATDHLHSEVRGSANDINRDNPATGRQSHDPDLSANTDNGTKTPSLHNDATDHLISEVLGSINDPNRDVQDQPKQSPNGDLSANTGVNDGLPSNGETEGVDEEEHTVDHTSARAESLSDAPPIILGYTSLGGDGGTSEKFHDMEVDPNSPIHEGPSNSVSPGIDEDNSDTGEHTPGAYDSDRPILLPHSSITPDEVNIQTPNDNEKTPMEGGDKQSDQPVLLAHPSATTEEAHIQTLTDTGKRPTVDDALQDRDSWILSAEPSFSIGLTQEGKEALLENPYWRSKRQKTVPVSLTESFSCDTPILQRVREAHMTANQGQETVDFSTRFKELCELTKTKFTIKVGGINICNKDTDAITSRTRPLTAKMIDALLYYTRTLFTREVLPGRWKRVAFFDSKFATCLGKAFSKFSNARNKETYRFLKEINRYFEVEGTSTMFSQCYYFPFPVDQKHWLGICVDFQKSLLLVLDCNISLRSDAEIASDLNPIAEMFPYLLKQAGRCLTSRDLLPLQVERAKHVPQNICFADAAITAVLLIQSHAIRGVDICRCITPESIDVEAQRLAVLLYDTYK